MASNRPHPPGFAMSSRTLFISAGLLGFTGVLLGALGAHALHQTLLARQMAEVWHTAVLYHLIHAVALLALSGLPSANSGRLPKPMAAAAWCWIAGVVFFSGSLYALALGAPRAFGPITPIGGLCFLAGWVLVVMTGWRMRPGPPRA